MVTGEIKQYDVFEIARDLNPVIVKGLTGVILEVLSPDVFEVEFLDREFNLSYEGEFTFTISRKDIKKMIEIPDPFKKL